MSNFEADPLPGMSAQDWHMVEAEAMIGEAKATDNLDLWVEGLERGVDALGESIDKLKADLAELENDTSIEDAHWAAILPLFNHIFPGETPPEDIDECIKQVSEALDKYKEE
jgi:hypothetical protein